MSLVGTCILPFNLPLLSGVWMLCWRGGSPYFNSEEESQALRVAEKEARRSLGPC